MLFTSPLLYVVDVNTTVKIMESQPNWIDLYGRDHLLFQ